MTATLTQTEAKFRADPSTARSTPTVTAVLANGHARLSAGPFNWQADLPVSIGGQNLAPSPTAYLLGALAGCAVAFLADTLAPQFGVRLNGVTAVARCESDARGLLAIDGVAPDLSGLALDIEVSSPDPEERTAPMLAAWRERCPIFLALVNANEVALTTRVAATAG